MEMSFHTARPLVVLAAGLVWPKTALADTASLTFPDAWLWGGSAVLALLTIGLLVLRWRKATRATDVAQAEARRSDLLLQQSGEGVIGLDGEMNVRFINPAARHMLGGVTRDVPFKWPETIKCRCPHTNETLASTETPLARAVAGERLYREVVELDRRPGAGRTRLVQMTSADLPDDPSGATVLLTLTQASAGPDRMDLAADAGGADTSYLSLGLLNDFNNALATIAYAIDLSLKHDLPEKPTSFLMTALSTVERGQQLTDQLLRFSDNAEVKAAPCVVRPLFDDFRMVIGAAIPSGVSLAMNCDDPVLTLRCSQRSIETILAAWVLERVDELAGMSRTGRIWIDARVAQPSKTLTRLALLQDEGTPFVEIVLSDNGPSLDRDTVHLLTSPTIEDGMAGAVMSDALNLAREFALQQGGDIRLISNGAEGVAISLVLPGEQSRASLKPIWQAKPERGSGETVFVVEDEASLLLMLQEELEDLGYRVISATSGAAALGLIEQGVEFDLVITDVVLPGEINGFDLAARIQDLRHGAGVLYMSGYHGFDSSDMGSAKAPILKKPAPPYELAEAVKTALVKRTQ